MNNEVAPIRNAVYKFLINKKIYRMQYVEMSETGEYLFEHNGYLTRPMSKKRFSYLYAFAKISVTSPTAEDRIVRTEYEKKMITERLDELALSIEPEKPTLKMEREKNQEELDLLRSLSSEEKDSVYRICGVTANNLADELEKKFDEMESGRYKFNRLDDVFVKRSKIMYLMVCSLNKRQAVQKGCR